MLWNDSQYRDLIAKTMDDEAALQDLQAGKSARGFHPIVHKSQVASLSEQIIAQRIELDVYRAKLRHGQTPRDPNFQPPSKPLVSILLNTINRYDMLVMCVGQALCTAGYPFELLCCDNGSDDRRTIDYIASLQPVYHRLNPTNEGCAQMHNQMLLRAKGKYFCLLDDDTEISGDNWLAKLVEVYDAVQDSGVSGIHSLMEFHDSEVVDGQTIRTAKPPIADALFGTRMFDRRVLDKVGYFCEDYGPYGLVDNEFNSRVHLSGFRNYYIDGIKAFHHGGDVGTDSPYRKMKDESMRIGSPIFIANMARRVADNDFYIPAPELR